MKYWKTEIPSRDYYAVIFCSTKSADLENYKEMDEKIMKLAIEQEGFLGYESAGGLDAGIFISYWKNIESIQKWRDNSDHIVAKKSGIDKWYDRFLSQICKVEHSHHFVRQK
jgi:heme-degrading monooxygenase HmoA